VKSSKKGGFCIVFIVMIMIIILLSSSSFSLKVFPTLTDLGENYDKEQSFILTILNDGPRAEDITMTVDAYSWYLKDYVKIEPESFNLKSNLKQNIQVTTRFPSNLSPEKHRLVLIPLSENTLGEKTIYVFNVPGTPRPDLRIAELDVKDVNQGELIAFNLFLDNKGNVIGRAVPIIEIYNGTEKIGEMKYEAEIMVMPFDTYNLTLLYDSSSLGIGHYSAKSVFLYNENLKTNDAEKSFKVLSESSKMKGSLSAYFNEIRFYIIFSVIIILIILIIKPEYLKSSFNSIKSIGLKNRKYLGKLANIEKRQKSLDKEVSELVKKTHAFVVDANHFLESKYGHGKYEFK
jgi:hypothetical protein